MCFFVDVDFEMTKKKIILEEGNGDNQSLLTKSCQAQPHHMTFKLHHIEFS